MSTNRYEILHSLGKGGMAEVFLAYDQLFETKVALKVLLPEFRLNESIKQRFLSEAKMLFQMSHPNIIKATDLINRDDMVAYAMDYIEGKSLRAFLDEGELKLGDLQQIEALFTPALNAVDHAHSNGILHRDLKPSNFMVSSSREMKLMDFGIAKQSDKTQDNALTLTGQMIGTPKYMSPEQVRSTKHVTEHSDIYSLGVILWELASNKGVYSEKELSAFDIQVKIVNEPLPALDNPLNDIIQKATAKRPEDRFASVGEFKEALGALQHPIQPRSVNSDETIIDAEMPSSKNEGVDPTIVDNSPPDSSEPVLSQFATSSGSESDEVICPRCTGTGSVNAAIIKKWNREEEWLPGPCGYCDATGAVTRSFSEAYDPCDSRIFMGWRDACLDAESLESWVREVSGVIDVHCDVTEDQVNFTYSFNMPVDWILDWHEGVVQLTEVHSNQGIGLIGIAFPDVPVPQYFFLLRSGVEEKLAVISSNRYDLLKWPLRAGFPDFETEVYWTSGECKLGHSMHEVRHEKSSVIFGFFDAKGAKKSYSFDFSSEREARASAIFWKKLIESPLGFMAGSAEEYADKIHMELSASLDDLDGTPVDGDYIKDRVSSVNTKGLTNITSCFNENWAGSKYSRHHAFLGRFEMPSQEFKSFSSGIYQDETVFGGGKSGIACVGFQFALDEEPYFVLLVRAPMSEYHIIPLFKRLPDHFEHPAYQGLVAYSVAQNKSQLVVVAVDSKEDEFVPAPVSIEIGTKSKAKLSVDFWNEILVEDKLNFLSH